MSEPMFPSADASTAAPAPGEVVTERGNRTALLALGGVAAAVIVGGAAFFLLSSGSSDPAPVAVAPSAASGGTAAKPAPSASPSTAPVVRAATVTVTSRDPFKPLFAPVVTTDGAAAAPAASASAAPAAGAPAPAPVATTKAVTITVADVNPTKQTATVFVDGKKYAAAVNAPFGTYYTVYSVFNASCVGILYGDQSVPVCTSKPATVTP